MAVSWYVRVFFPRLSAVGSGVQGNVRSPAKEDDINKTFIYQKYATSDHSNISVKVGDG